MLIWTKDAPKKSNIFGLTRPNAEVMLANGRSRLRIVEIPIMHLEFERSKDAIEDNVKLLDHLAVA